MGRFRGKFPASTGLDRGRQIAIACILGILFFPVLGSTAGATTKTDFLFELRVALKARDRDALRKCFAFQGADPATTEAIEKAIEQIISWPAQNLKVSERSKTGPIIMERDGGSYTLNGDWQFQVHIQATQPKGRGFVLPAGVTSEGRYAILLSVPVR